MVETKITLMLDSKTLNIMMK